MNKSERLNDMIRYLNGRDFFHLHDLMEKYQISKSTALRDIKSLEQLGMPIFVEYGRYGRYRILKNRLLSPIMFTMDELYALYFAMLTLKSYESTPFHLSVDQLNEKFESCLSPKQIEQIEIMKRVLQFEMNQHHHESRFLDKILQSILNESNCTIQYSINNEEKCYLVQFFKISAKFGQWYASGIDLTTNQYRVFRCDRVTDMVEESTKSPFTIDDLLNRSLELYRSEFSIDFEVEIEEDAQDIFYKEHYPSMKIDSGNRTVIRGFYNPGEEAFIADFFMKFGNQVISVKPESLRELIKERIEKLLSHYKFVLGQ
ncbi:YafY family transcriptional regulator [Xylanibacillus composti]|uniref:Transcriptional regulator n=2 Tax=Paenibacillaceae TaxID=186822 RepID=A0A8J4H3A8_9BACL|nr:MULTISPECIES: YafY family protein [Paenibacillaceae]MBP1895868.1 putative DNA-binding transcriptional regulator YafY [Paenibacillus lactis]MDT9725227.1 YafY family transcriptional regulator [Xylanibacillus composti]GIQ70079.1 transcriptional regulator [Xylanibacillus composti]HAG01539.1 transcriptional regulator [Paenibacillus lactis]